MNGLMAYCTVYSFGMTAYGCYADWCYLHGRTPATEIGVQGAPTVVSQPVQTSQNNPLTNITYTEKVEQQQQNDFHGFPYVVDNFGSLGQQTQFIGGDGNLYTKLRILGSYKSYEEYFTYIWDTQNKCNHRCFEMIE
ncbi:MAG: hypothetical protein J5789_06215 [Oscillospiraceae bacterium]|nr:hypothetical protein [Oscillospiraceae bacterium]